MQKKDLEGRLKDLEAREEKFAMVKASEQTGSDTMSMHSVFLISEREAVIK